MYVRKKKNRSGTTSVVIVKKRNGRVLYLETIGVSSDEKTLADLYIQGKKRISIISRERDMFTLQEQVSEEKQITDYLLCNIENILLNGAQLILNQVFNLIGFNSIGDDILKHLVISRLCQPSSKAGTVDYLKSYFDEDLELHNVYRYLGRRYNKSV
jgi:hypothetical protein